MRLILNYFHTGIAIFVFLLLICALAVQAQDDAPIADARQKGHLDNLKICQPMPDETERLACYDQAVNAMLAATEKGDLQVVDREDIQKTKRGLFGFSLPKVKLFGDDNDAEAQMLESTITKVNYFRKDALTFMIEDGNAVWQITNAPSRLREVKPGDTVVFKKAALSSYFIRVNGQLGVKGKRIR